MKKLLAVLLLRVEGAPDQPSRTYAEQLFTKAGKGTRNLDDYYDEMSHGRLDISETKVFGGMDYGHTIKDLSNERDKAKTEKKKALIDAGVSESDAETAAVSYAIDVRREKIKEWGRQAAANNDIDLRKFDVTVFVFNQPVDYFGNDGDAVLNWDDSKKQAAYSVELTGVSHEVGHALGMLSHSRKEGSAEEYGDPWDIMSAYTVYSDKSGTGIPPGSPYFTFGPGLNAVNMDIEGWLDPTRVFSGTGSGSFKLRPLHRRDLSGWLAARLEGGFEDLFVEFRMNDRWDARIPQPCILLHRRTTHPVDNLPCSELLVANPDATPGPRAQLRQGESFEAGAADDPFGFFARITVTRIDVENQQAFIKVYIRQRRHFEPQGTPFAGVTAGGDGYVWTPGRGFVKVHPRSPLLAVLELLAEVETLQGISASERGDFVQKLAHERLSTARDRLTAIIEARQQPRVPARLTERGSTDLGQSEGEGNLD